MKVKFYENGQEFVNDNRQILNKSRVENPFMEGNGLLIKKISCEDFLFKAEDGDKYLLGVRKKPFNLVLYGDKELAEEAASFAFERNLKFSSLLSEYDLGQAFLKAYSLFSGASYTSHLDMNILECRECPSFSCEGISSPSEKDKKELIALLHKFSAEALGEDFEEDTLFLNKLEKEYSSYYIIRDNNKIVSMAKKNREDAFSCSVSSVYTEKEYRGRGLCYRIVGYITSSILSEGKRAYLYVDNTNPFSNHVYRKIGYQDVLRQAEYKIKPSSSLKTIILAGGCFWCASKPYYEYEGVKRVLSGYAGGKECNPDYEKVKHQETSHRESVMIQYDSDKISFGKIIDIYFETTDPFDNEGQFIDKGHSYTLAVFTSLEEERTYLKERISSLEKEYGRKVYISVEEDSLFYKAEEYHQDFALKHPDLMEKELVSSGRKKH